jgi:peroxiredoxin
VSAELTAKLGLEFPLLRDDQGTLLRAWGVYDAGNNVAKPATMVIAAGGKIIYRHDGTTAIDVAPTAEVVAAAKALATR